MKSIRLRLTSASFALAIFSPVLIGGVASAQRIVQLPCPVVIEDGEFSSVNNNYENCDLSVDKLVSVNGGAFVEADTSSDAAFAHVGDTVTWKIIVTNNSPEGLTPHGVVYVKDELPSGVSYQSYSATNGTYNYNDGSLFENDWVLPLQDTLPATLTITTKSISTGLFQNTAILSLYDTGSCDGGCPYADADPSNNSNDAWIDPQSNPVVLGASTTVLGAPNTGYGKPNSTDSSILALVASATILISTGLAVLYRQKKIQ
jgi:uncharacterized repeat protein (TIGR01451 family)